MPAKSNKVAHQQGRRWASIPEGAAYMGVHLITIRRLIAEGKLNAYRGAGWKLVRVDLNELDALITGGK